MQVGKNFEFTTLLQAPYGRLLVARFGGKEIVRGLKAFCKTDNKTQIDQFVTLGPFFTRDEGQPTIYDLKEGADQPAFDITDACKIVPSLAPSDLIFGFPANIDIIGSVVFGQEKNYLKVRTADRYGTWGIGFLDLESGRISFDHFDKQSYVSRSWKIVSTDSHVNQVTYFEFPLKE